MADEDIVYALSNKGICVASRTVADWTRTHAENFCESLRKVSVSPRFAKQT